MGPCSSEPVPAGNRGGRGFSVPGKTRRRGRCVSAGGARLVFMGAGLRSQPSLASLCVSFCCGLARPVCAAAGDPGLLWGHAEPRTERGGIPRLRSLGLRELDLFSLGKRCERGSLIYVHRQGGVSENGAGFGFVVLGNKPRGGGQAMHAKLPLNTSRGFFAVD